MRLRAALVVLVVCARFAGAAAPRLVVVALGDSTTAGTPFFSSPLEAPPNGRGDASAPYPAALASLRPGWRVLNRGIDGERADEIRARFDRDVFAERARFVVILAGVNDAYQGRSPEATEADLLWMYERAARRGVEPVLATVMPFTRAEPEQTARIRELNAWIGKTAAARGWAFVDLHAAVASPDDPDRLAASPDGLHPDRAGYAAAARAVAAAIDARLARKKKAAAQR